jgi:hypothetical protein
MPATSIQRIHADGSRLWILVSVTRYSAIRRTYLVAAAIRFLRVLSGDSAMRRA